ncbi:MAG: protein TolQ [Thiomicrorhabdus sp.]|nr:protein TolQ [Thiomicrorhabdus sp.]
MDSRELIELVLEASAVVQAIMVLLIFMSLVVWAVAFSKWYQIRVARKAAQEFMENYQNSSNLTQFYREDQVSKNHGKGLSHIFLEGFKEFLRLKNQDVVEVSDLMNGTQRMMKVAFSKEADKLEERLSILATVGSSAPYIGLLGTVWGVMHAFQGLGGMHNATLAAVAPGISEALIVTAVGLFAAIPAVITYNSLTNSTDRLLNEYENFAETFLSTLQRDASLSKK